MDSLPDFGATGDPGVEEVSALSGDVTLSPGSIAGGPFVTAEGFVDVLV